MNTTTPPRRPTWGDELEQTATRLGTPPIYGPPVAFLLGPWLFLVLLLAPPFALLFAVALVLAVAAVLLAALGAVLASPFLLLRHLRAHRAGQARLAAPAHPFRKLRVSFGRLGSPQAKGMS